MITGLMMVYNKIKLDDGKTKLIIENHYDYW